jgi:hypothetical protein
MHRALLTAFAALGTAGRRMSTTGLAQTLPDPESVLHPAPTTGRTMIEFQHYDDTYSGMGSSGRRWRILPTFTGWRLEFRDPDDRAPTYAGTHPTLRAAQAEASR